MKLLFVAQDYGNHAGGSEICLETFLKLFTNDRHDCVLVTENKQSSQTTIKNFGRLKIVRIPERKLSKEVRRQIAAFKPDFLASQKDWGARFFLRYAK